MIQPHLDATTYKKDETKRELYSFETFRLFVKEIPLDVGKLD